MWRNFRSICGERDLCGIEKPGALSAIEGAEENALGDAGDEVADVVVADERGHGFSKGGGGALGGSGFGLIDGDVDLEGAVECVAAAGDGVVGVGGLGFSWIGHEGFSLDGELTGRSFLPTLIVKELGKYSAKPGWGICCVESGVCAGCECGGIDKRVG